MIDNQVAGGIIGCGKISKLHVESMRAAGIRVAAFCDSQFGRAEEARGLYAEPRARTCSDYTQLLADPAIEVVAIATPPHVHAEQTAAALRAGKHVYCEKPVGRTLVEYDPIFQAEQQTGRRAYFTPGRFRAGRTPLVMDYVRDGSMGEICRVEARHFRPRGRPGVDSGSPWFCQSHLALAGILGDMGLYFIDQCMHVTGWPRIEAISAVTYRQFPADVPASIVNDVEEHAVIQARTAGKLTFTFEFASIGYYDSWTTTTLRFLGTRAGVTLQTGRQEINQLLTDKGPGRYVMHQLEWKDPKTGDVQVYEQLVAAIKANQTPQVTMAPDSRQMMTLHEIMQMTYLSAKLRREVRADEIDRNAPIFQLPAFT